MPRTIHFELDTDTLERIEVVTGRDALHQALGYLSQWASGSGQYAHVELRGANNSFGIEIVATYRAEPMGHINYQIGAVWHPHSDAKGKPAGHFGFHS